MVDQMTADASSGPPPPPTPVRPTAVTAAVTPNVRELQIIDHRQDDDIAALRLQVQELQIENALLKGYIGEDPASYTEGRNVRLMQWNLQDLTKGGDVQGPLWKERRRNIVNTILFHKPDIVAIEEVKAGKNGTAAFKDIVDRLGDDYVGEPSDPVSGGPRGERVGLIWRTRLANADAVTFNLLVGPNKPADERSRDATNISTTDTVAAAARRLVGEAGVLETVEACAAAFREARERTLEQDFDRHLVLATLETNLGPLHILIGHLDTEKNRNKAEVNVIKELASRAWAAGAWLFVMADTNTDEAENRGIWDTDDYRTFAFKELGCRALPPGRPTNAYPHQYATQTEDETIKAKPKRNDEIFIPGSWRVVSAETARMCPAALGAWAPAATKLLVDVEEGRKSSIGIGRTINNQLTLRWSDHLAVIAEVCFIKTSVEPDFGAELNALFP